MLYVVCYPAMKMADRLRIERFRRKHEPSRARLIQAHITLMFGVAVLDIRSLKTRVSAVASQQAPFDISMETAEIRADPLSGEWKLFLMVGKGRSAFTDLHRRLHAGLDVTEDRDVPFSPHVTVASSVSRDEIQAAWEASARLGLPLVGRAEALDIVALREDRLDGLGSFRLGLTEEPLEDLF